MTEIEILKIKVENLETELNACKESHANAQMNLQHVTEKLNEAKEILTEICNAIPMSLSDYLTEPLKKAELFLKEE